MQNDFLVLSSMALIQGEDHLCENAPYKIFINKILFIIAWRPALLNEFTEVAALAILHYKVDACVLLVNKFIEASYNILMFQFP